MLKQTSSVFVLIGLIAVAMLAACGPAETNIVKNTPVQGKTETTVEKVETGPWEGTKLIPREVLFGNPERARARISPDGKRISYLAPKDGVMNVYVGPADDLDAAKPVTNDTKRGIRIYFWAYDNRHIVYLQDKGGDENWQAFSVDVLSGKEVSLTPFEKVQARIQAVSHKKPDEIVVALNKDNPQFHSLYKVNLATGKLTTLLENKEFVGFVTDDDYNVKLGMKVTPEGGSEVFVPKKLKGQWKSLMKIPQEDMLTTGPIGFSSDGQTLYLRDSRNRDTGALFALNVKTQKARVIVESDKADIDDVMIHPIEKNVEAAFSTYTRRTVHVVDKALEDDFTALKMAGTGEWEVVDRSLDDKKWIVAYTRDAGPVEYVLFDRTDKKSTKLFVHRSDLVGLPLAKMYPAEIPSRDGKTLVSYYTLPVWADSNGKAKEPHPMVLLVHGGPWGRDKWGYHPFHQWLANRGYAVLSVNFRGSTGFGKSFINAGDKEWAGKMHDDLIDGVNWAVEQGIADRNRVAIMGGSYGGYATLVGLTFTPNVFAAGVDIVGPSNLETLLASIPPYWAPILSVFTSRVGDPKTEEGKKLLAERSPINKVDAIKRPLLIGQGANDPRVKQAESDQIVRAMKGKNLPVTYVLYPDEGHGFARPENRLSFFAVTEAFLAEHLGGRAEPVGDAFKGSSIQILEGADDIPGLPPTVGGSSKLR